MAILGDTKAVSLSLLDGVIGNLNPKTTEVYDLGTSSLKWRNIYGALKGNADTATSATKASLLTNTHVTNEAAAMPTTKGLFGIYTITSDSSGLSNDGHVLSGTWHNNDTNFGYQLFIDTDPTYKMALRQRNGSGVWQAWKLIPMADGTNASGTWDISITGNAATATKLATARSLKTKLDSTTAVTFDGSADQNTIPVTGTLPVGNGGTGATSFTANSLIMSGSTTTSALTTRAITNNTSATAAATGTNIPTMNTLYYALPKINNAKTYTSSSTFYAPTVGGTSGYVLVGNGTTSAPTWSQTVAVANGGTGATSASGARTNLGLGTIATHAEGDYVTTSGNAASATYASNIRVTQIAPTNNTGYCLAMTQGSTANTNYAPLVHPDAARIWADANDTDGITQIALHMGNATISGAIKLFDGNGKAINLSTETVTGTGNRVITLPDANGTILTTAGGQTITDTLTVDYTSSTSGTVYPITASRNAPGTSNAGVGVIARNTGSGLSVNISIGAGGQNHGLYSSGYYNGTTYTQDGSWMVYRKSDGKVYFIEANNGNVVISNQGRKLFVTTSASVPSGAKAGDIVLVKA